MATRLGPAGPVGVAPLKILILAEFQSAGFLLPNLSVVLVSLGLSNPQEVSNGVSAERVGVTFPILPGTSPFTFV